jgi:hypothetical protein
VSSAREDAVPYFPTGAGRVSASTVETAIKLKMLMDVAIMLTEEDFEDLGWRRDVIWLFHHGREQNEITYIQTECAILVSSVGGHSPSRCREMYAQYGMVAMHTDSSEGHESGRTHEPSTCTWCLHIVCFATMSAARTLPHRAKSMANSPLPSILVRSDLQEFN